MGRIRAMIETMMESTGLARLEAAVAPARGAVVLMYHSVADGADRDWIDPSNDLDPGAFARQMEFLVASRRVVSMGGLVDSIVNGCDLPKSAVVLTFDDGYLNNARVVAPILKKLGLPATLYLPTRYIDGGETQWVDRLYVAFKARTRHSLSLVSPAVNVDISGSVEELAAVDLCRRFLLGASYLDRRRVLEEIEEQLRPDGVAPRTTMNWSEVRAMREENPGWEFGVHTVEHRDLSACDEVTARREIDESVAVFAREMGYAPQHFSFPYGRSTGVTRGMVCEAGLNSAVAARPGGPGRSGEDAFWIGRVEAPRTLSRLKYRTSAAYPGIAGWIGGRA